MKKHLRLKDINLRPKTTNNEFNALIPDTVTSVIFTDEVMPDSVTLIDVDAD